MVWTFTCSPEIVFNSRGWGSKAADHNTVKASIRDHLSREIFTISGSYTEDLTATDVRTGHSWTIIKAPQRPEDVKKAFGMNDYSMQLNMRTKELLAKLPATDSRWRKDLAAVEAGN